MYCQFNVIERHVKNPLLSSFVAPIYIPNWNGLLMHSTIRKSLVNFLSALDKRYIASRKSGNNILEIFPSFKALKASRSLYSVQEKYRGGNVNTVHTLYMLVAFSRVWPDIWPTDIWPTDIRPTDVRQAGPFTDRHLADRMFGRQDIRVTALGRQDVWLKHFFIYFL